MGNLCSRTEESTSARAIVNAEVAANWAAPAQPSETDPDRRTYHAEKNAPYVLPDDVKEGSRLNLQHHLFRATFGGPNHAGVTDEQLKNGLTVLDIGCGTGIWLAEMQRDFPKGKYFGVDIAKTAWAETFKDISAGSITLLQGNVLERLPFEDNTFDYVHQQLLVLGVPEPKWPHVVSEICRVLKPGGILDLVEVNAVYANQGTPSKRETQFWETLMGLFKARGINLKVGNDLPRYVRDAPGLERVVEGHKTAPIGWGGEVGALWRVDSTKGYLGMKPFASASLGMSGEEWEELVHGFHEDAAESKAYVNIVRVTASKAQKA